MPPRSLADFLPDFGAERKSAPPSSDRQQIQPPPAAGGLPSIATPAQDIGALVSAEVALAEARVREEMQSEADAAISAEREQHAAEIAALNEKLGAEAAARISSAIADAEARIAELTAGTAARILSSVLSDELTRKSVAHLAATVRAAIADKDAVRIKVVGPAPLFETLKGALGPAAARCDFAEAPGFDLTVSVEGTLYETRLAEWSAAIGEAVF
jgi:hypothetical protein